MEMQEGEEETEMERENEERVSDTLLKFIPFKVFDPKSTHHSNLNGKELENLHLKARSLSKN